MNMSSLTQGTGEWQKIRYVDSCASVMGMLGEAVCGAERQVGISEGWPEISRRLSLLGHYLFNAYKIEKQNNCKGKKKSKGKQKTTDTTS